MPQARALGRAVFDLELVRRLHTETMRSDAGYHDPKGHFRDSVVWIGGGDISQSTYNPLLRSLLNGAWKSTFGISMATGCR